MKFNKLIFGTVLVMLLMVGQVFGGLDIGNDINPESHGIKNTINLMEGISLALGGEVGDRSESDGDWSTVERDTAFQFLKEDNFCKDSCTADHWSLVEGTPYYFDPETNKFRKITQDDYDIDSLWVDETKLRSGYISTSEGAYYALDGKMKITSDGEIVDTLGEPLGNLPAEININDIDSVGIAPNSDVALIVTDDTAGRTVHLVDDDATASFSERVYRQYQNGWKNIDVVDENTITFGPSDGRYQAKIDENIGLGTTETEITSPTGEKESILEWTDGSLFRFNDEGTSLTIGGTTIDDVSLELQSDGTYEITNSENQVIYNLDYDSTNGELTRSLCHNNACSYPQSVVVTDAEEGTSQSMLFVGNDDEYRLTSDREEFSNGMVSTTSYSQNEDGSYDGTRIYSNSEGARIAQVIGDQTVQDQPMTPGEGDTVAWSTDDKGRPIFGVVSNPDQAMNDGKINQEELVDGGLRVSELNQEYSSMKGGANPSEELKKTLGCENNADCFAKLDAMKSFRQELSRIDPETAKNIASDILFGDHFDANLYGLSSAFYTAVGAQGFVREVDSWYSRWVLNEEAIASAICYNLNFAAIDQPESGTAVMENSAGQIQTIAHIFAEVTPSDSLLCQRNTNEEVEDEFVCPDELYCGDDGFCYDETTDERAVGYFYKISWGVGSPRDELSTPNVDENGIAVKYNIWLDPSSEDSNGDNLHVYQNELGEKNCPLMLINGDIDGAVVTWWSNKDYTGDRVCIKWGCGTQIYSTGGSAYGKASLGKLIPDVCNTIQPVEQGTVSMVSSSGQSSSHHGSEDVESQYSGDISVALP